jgi:hypothetical protein
MMKKVVLDASTGELSEVDLSPEEQAEYDAREAEDAAQASERLKLAILDAAQTQLNEFANTRGYDGIMSACTYATSTIPKFAAEGQYCVQLRDETWATLYGMLAEIEAGTRPLPESFEDIAHELPLATAVWPT